MAEASQHTSQNWASSTGHSHVPEAHGHAGRQPGLPGLARELGWRGGGAGHPASSASGCFRHWQNRRRKPRNNAAGLTSGKGLVLIQKEGEKSGRLQRIRTGHAGKKMHVLFLKKERDWMK